ncbi:DoxX family protein [Robertmurraya sp. DFI.2.37]|uniref:DoxX family membrane protein n=1 Tax=Robertmurraya sp. DFI.2.37 TaxID=3031819 RepID=UPI001244F43C|nr:DoxX family protein [Robertmurraya sp. DFI.2.37]MDF1508463.1 DoxX family protein [Robertmurraya sp. DFI.2.37]
MIGKLLRENNIVAGLLTVVRIYLGWAWMTAGWGKITGGFDASGFLKGAVANPVTGPDGSPVYSGWVSFLDSFAVPNAGLFSPLVAWGELLVGLGLILGCLTTAAAFFALVMNFSFMLSGTVSHNPTDILMGVFIAAAGYNAGKYGLDRYVLPYLRKLLRKSRNKESHIIPT